MDTRERLIQLKEESGYNWKVFAAYFDVPYRTIQDWYMGKRRISEYLLRLMYYKMQMEKIVSKDDDTGSNNMTIAKGEGNQNYGKSDENR